MLVSKFQISDLGRINFCELVISYAFLFHHSSYNCFSPAKELAAAVANHGIFSPRYMVLYKALC